MLLMILESVIIWIKHVRSDQLTSIVNPGSSDQGFVCHQSIWPVRVLEVLTLESFMFLRCPFQFID